MLTYTHSIHLLIYTHASPTHTSMYIQTWYHFHLYENPPPLCHLDSPSHRLYSLHYWHTHTCTYTPYVTHTHMHALIVLTLLPHTCMHLSRAYKPRGIAPNVHPCYVRTHTHTHTTNVTTPIVPLLRLRHVHSSPSERKANNKEHTKHYCTRTCIHTLTHAYTHSHNTTSLPTCTPLLGPHLQQYRSYIKTQQAL